MRVRSIFIHSAAVWLASILSAFAGAAAAEVDLERIMADPDWIGPPVEAAWWQLDGSAYVYRVKRPDSAVRDLFRVRVDDGRVRRLGPAERRGIDAPEPVFDRGRTRALMERDGSLFVRDLGSGRLDHLYSGAEPVDEADFSTDGTHAHFRSGGRWYRIALGGGNAVPVADLRFEDDPLEPADDELADDQRRLFETLAREREREREQRRDAIAAAAADPTARPVAWYLGDDHEAAATALSPDARWMLVTVRAAGHDDGRADRMPRFVSESGYVEIEDVRTLVGREPPAPQQVWLLDLADRQRHAIDLAGLPGRDEDPLAELKNAQDIEPHDADDPRPLTIENVEWHPSGRRVLFQAHSIDNKDRWTVVLDVESREPRPVHRLTDPAWINWTFNESGWVPGTDTVWLLSEQSGYSHLYTVDAAGSLTQHSDGDFEVYSVTFDPDAASALVLSNRAHPTESDVWRIDLDRGSMSRLTELKGVESYAVLPGRDDLLIRHSAPYVPPQAGVLDASSDRIVARTDTRTEAYRDIDWQAPEFVAVPSTHGAGQPIWSKFYPARTDAPGPHPVVVFVHGAGYTQNTHHRFPYYFREQMFHNLLTARGWHVIDMDYRASRGYGRDWRTAIYRHMGKPELEDLRDGVAWVIDEHDGDADRVGVYGGSYGGFMAFMAMFNAADVFGAGAALRPVTDWRHYNHGYTSNILNTPDVDPEAYRRSSPIEFVDGLQGSLLISHGMLDDNVFYKDSVRLSQRLIELGKTDWEFASYPLEPHSYEHPESWLDQYRRILALLTRRFGAKR